MFAKTIVLKNICKEHRKVVWLELHYLTCGWKLTCSTVYMCHSMDMECKRMKERMKAECACVNVFYYSWTVQVTDMPIKTMVLGKSCD